MGLGEEVETVGQEAKEGGANGRVLPEAS